MTMPPCPQLRDYARAVLADLRRDRDWYRSAARRIYDDGGRICRTEWDGTAWTVLDWRTGTALATGERPRCLRRRLGPGLDRHRLARPAARGLAGPPPGCRQLAGRDTAAAPPPGPLQLPGVPPPLAVLLGEVISCWACSYDPDDPGHTADVAALAGLTVRQVAACTASHYQLDGAAFMDLAAETKPGSD